ncbi:MAG: alanine--glyoxylate aminotransferase family protein [Caldilineaceae bacterium]|nr:alanine--glyoxylate aminotransferase family protein [Caldilineaceae bacterium]
MSNQPKLFTPGPVDLFDETLEALSRPVPYMMHPEWLAVQAETNRMLKQIFQTENDIFIATSPGSGALETGVASLFQAGDRVIAIRNGTFAERLIQLLSAYRCEVIPVEGAWGEAIDLDKVADTLKQNPAIDGIAVVGNETGTGVRNPIQELAEMAHAQGAPILVDAVSGMGGYDIPVDKWGLDVVATSSNKALEMAPGLGIISVNPRAWELVERKTPTANRGWYYNLITWREALQRPVFPFPTTPATTSIAGLHASLKRILEVETLAGHWARYAWAQRVLRTGLGAIGFGMLAGDDVASPTVSTVCLHPAMENIEELRDYLRDEHDALISTSGGPLQGKVARISHMGKAGTQGHLVPLLLAVEEFLRRRKGIAVPVGASLVGLDGEGRWY